MKARNFWLLALWIAACTPAETPKQVAADPANGGRVYRRYCSTCHGVDGDGAGPWAMHDADTPPRDFTLGLYKLRSTPPGALPTDADLARTVSRGIAGTAMPGWRGTMSGRDVADVVSYLERFSPRFSNPDEPREPMALPKKAQPETAGAIARGRNLYLLLKCWDCHGVKGDGAGPAAGEQKDASGRPVPPRDLRSGVFKGGRSPLDLYRTLATGFDGTPMVAVFDSPRTMLAPLVLQRDQYQKDMKKLEQQLDAAEVATLRKYLATLPSPAELELLRDDQLAWLLERWRWDLVHYLRSLSSGGAAWRTFLAED